MKKLFLLVLALMLISSMALAQTTGSVSGTVHDSLDNPVGGAMINLMRVGDPHQDYHAQSAMDGTFSIPDVEAGSYIALAFKMMVGHDRDSIEVVAGQNTVVNFVLSSGNPPPPPPPDETGSVSGTVRDTLNNPVAGAMVDLMAPGGHHHGGPGLHYHTQTATDGTFSFAEVAVGGYLAMASKMMVGRDIDSITVAADQNTEVNFVLTIMGDHDGHGWHGDSLEIVTLTGWAMVRSDSAHTHYFLDANGDDTADFRLIFGPPWYEPGNGVHRPNDGDSIWITGGLMGYAEPQAVVVYEINGLFWRQPGHGHGGHGGHGGGCPDPDSVVLIETAGQAIVEDSPMMDHYFLDTNYDDTADYVLIFGPPWYDPGNGATRPEDGDSVTIVGGLLEGPEGNLDHIIVYEINGQFWWRDPGDTTALWADPLSTYEPGDRLPSSYLVASSYPNPFNPTATIYFELTQPKHVKVTVFDLLGRKIAVLADGTFPAGSNQVEFNASEGANGSAVYFYRVEAGSEVATGKMVLLK